MTKSMTNMYNFLKTNVCVLQIFKKLKQNPTEIADCARGAQNILAMLILAIKFSN